jgi:hypothetical protein
LNPLGSALVYSTYFGGNSLDEGEGIAVDAAGNAYVTGVTSSPNFPTVNPLQSHYSGAFVSKISSTGSVLVYSSYFGGTGGEGAGAIALDSAANVYIAGSTFSTDFPLVNAFDVSTTGVFSDAFVAKLRSAGP